MTKLFNQYLKSYNDLKDLEQDDLPRSLRLFNIRLRLAIDILVDFKGEISLTKTKSVRETYVLIFQLLEAWNAYEALSHYAKEVSSYVSPGVSKSKIYTQSFLKNVGSLNILQNALIWIKTEYSTNRSMNQSLDRYFLRFNQDLKLSKSLKDDAESVKDYLNNNKNISGIEVLSLIYAERNLYYHNGETAKMGMNYSSRKKLVSKYREVLIEHMLRTAIYIIDEKIAESI